MNSATLPRLDFSVGKGNMGRAEGKCGRPGINSGCRTAGASAAGGREGEERARGAPVISRRNVDWSQQQEVEAKDSGQLLRRPQQEQQEIGNPPYLTCRHSRAESCRAAATCCCRSRECASLLSLATNY